MLTLFEIEIEIGIDIGIDTDIDRDIDIYIYNIYIYLLEKLCLVYARVFQFHSWQFHSWQSSWHSMSFPFSLIHSMLKPTSSLRNEVVLHWGVDLTWEIQAANASWSFKIEFYEQQDPIDPNHLNTDLLPKPLPLPISSHLFPSLPTSSHLFPFHSVEAALCLPTCTMFPRRPRTL